MNDEGESVLLSEMQNAGMIENCGWLSRLIKAAAVTTVTSAATAVVVATDGTGVGAVVIYDFDVRSGSLAIGMFGADSTHFGTYSHYDFSTIDKSVTGGDLIIAYIVG